MELGLDGHVVLITGASGGIGRALATAFAAEGCRLALLAGRRREALEAWVADQPWADRAACGAADLREPDGLATAVQTLADTLGGLDHAVLNAGIWPEDDTPLHAMAVERVRAVVEVDLLGALWSARAVLSRWARQGPRDDGAGRSLTFIGSTAGAFGEAGHVPYAAAKGALRATTLSLKNEIVRLDPAGRVNLVEPGWTETPMAAGAVDDAAQVARSLATTPLHRVGQPEDVAAACVFLASPTRARHLTGQIVGVHGGMEGRRLR